MSRRDDINILYRPSKILGKACVFLFCTNIVVSLIAVYVSGNVVSYITTALVVIAFLYMVLSIIDDGIFWYRAESARRKNSVQAAYRIRLDKYELKIKEPNYISSSSKTFQNYLIKNKILCKDNLYFMSLN